MAGGPIERTRRGEFRLRLAPPERELLRTLPGELRSLLAANPADPALDRLFPPAFEDLPEEESEYRRLIGDELDRGHRDALDVLEKTADSDVLRAEEMESWLRALNVLRLVLGTRLGVTEDLAPSDLDPADPQAHELAVYVYLTWLQEQVVAAVSRGR
jgi:hypothetical protein